VNTLALCEVTNILMGQSPPSSSYNSTGKGLPFFQGKADFGDVHPKVRMYCTQPARVAETNDILISVRAPVGPTNINLVKSCVGRGLAAIRSGSNVDHKYLFYFLRFYEPKLAQIGKGLTFEAINRDDLESIQFPLIKLSEQKRIAAILDKADRLRRTRRYAQQLSDTFLQSVFGRMFGDPVKNPKEWPVMPLRQIAEKFSDGPFGSYLKTEHYTHSGVRVIRLQNIGIGEFLDDDKEYISESHFETLLKHGCVPGDVIVGTMGDPNLRACILPNTIHEALNKADCVQIRPDSTKAKAEYICWLLNLPHTLFLATGMILGQTRSRISMGRLAELQVPIAPLALQEKFALIVQRFERLRAQQREAARQAEHLFQTLLHRAFRGEL